MMLLLGINSVQNVIPEKSNKTSNLRQKIPYPEPVQTLAFLH